MTNLYKNTTYFLIHRANILYNSYFISAETPIFEFMQNFTTYNEFRHYLINNVSYDNHGNQTLWGPILVSEQFDIEFFYRLDVYPIFLETVSKMAVIVPYNKLSLFVKLFSGAHKLYFLLLLALLACCLTGWYI